MTFYSWWQKMEYHLKAKSRHGVHSPFVYDFIEQVLLCRHNTGVPGSVPAAAGGNKKQHDLLEAIANRYKTGGLVWGNRHCTLDETGAGILYLLTAQDKLPGQCSENDIVVMMDIYGSAGQTSAWRELAESKTVPLSIDVYEMGILFFKKEFKVKQHFILKYR